MPLRRLLSSAICLAPLVLGCAIAPDEAASPHDRADAGAGGVDSDGAGGGGHDATDAPGGHHEGGAGGHDARLPDDPPEPEPEPDPEPEPEPEPEPQGCEGSSCGELSIFVVDIGQGDATLVLGPFIEGRRRALVIDAGNRYPDGGAIMADLLTELGVAQLDYVILSHFDGDHIGGFVTISGSTSLLWNTSACDATAWFPTQGIYDQGTDTNDTSSSAQWKTCVPLIAAERSVGHHRVEGGAGVGTQLDLGGGHRAMIVAGDGYVIDRAERVSQVNTPNERSIAVLVSNDSGFDFLVTGDLIGRAAGAENAPVEGALGAALKARDVDVEVLRTGHHGAANASELGFLTDIAPEVAIISTGDDQPSSYQHPRCDTYDTLGQAGIGLVLQTELGGSDCAADPPVEPVVVNGTIRLDVQGAAYTVTNHGAASPANGRPTAAVEHRCHVDGGC